MLLWRWFCALAVLPALFMFSGCATGSSPGPSPFSRAAPAEKNGPAAFTLEIKSPRPVEQYLLRHLELLRYRELSDLDTSELNRLLTAAEANARDLLGTLGYFSPSIAIELLDTPADAASLRKVIMTVEPGLPVRIGSVDISFEGEISANAASNPAVATQTANIRGLWPLPPGRPFTQAEWDDAKSFALRGLTSQRYPTGQISDSRADIDTDTQSASLTLKLDSGPAYRFGPVQVSGTQHYPPELVTRLAQVPTGADYDQQRLLEAQQRVADSGYFDSVFMALDTAGNPQAAPVTVQVREAKLQKIVLGVGISTDGGPRLSVEHTHHLLPVIGWRAVSKASVDRQSQSIGSELTAQPDADYWRWVTSALLERKDTNAVVTNSQRLRLGRTQTGERIDRSYFLQYDQARDRGVALDTQASSITANYAWTRRNFDALPFPTRGHGLSLELGGGTTLGSQRDPFLRTRVNWLGLWPTGTVTQAEQADGLRVRGGRLALRAEGGAVLAREGANLPSTQLFLTGGDNTVRGYGYRDIGVNTASGASTVGGAAGAKGAPVAGRYLAVGSVEYQHPITWQGRLTDWETAVFVDAGSVADKPADLKAKVGVGVGARWRSPVGPLNIDLAYGVAVKRLRLHLSVGFSF
ncbi:MAG: outer membrane protein assembly factor [Bdellovibrionales bacterium]|nr:outer membrane protein assembly factor [Ramlibacter sp.]